MRVDIDNAPLTYIGGSQVEGKGLFSLNGFNKGDIILDYTPFKDTFIKTLWKDLSHYQTQHNWIIPVDDEYCLTSDSISKIHYVNHSREPNGDWQIANMLIVAARDIQKDEEIFIDYRLEYRPTRTQWPEWI
jgi:SET domain-containing protein